ncbi:hypothetical protein [Natrinema gari]|uniref:Uncharacterized protein n=1 Tax=Natrinema gari JCM 14663 TaxID=1230459 RepID=L9ZG38_9EURY|nr:hypothetical protein [Natrinema gari]ELY85425.1 hypothetical protein C486_00100 [Natrinema gari JCM 14663]
MTNLRLRDETATHDGGAGTRTLVYGLPAPWLLHGLFRSDAYVSHTAGNVTVDVALAAGTGYATGMVVPTDGVPRAERSFEDYFSGGPTRPADKAAVTFRTDIHDADAVIPAVETAAETGSEIRGESK